MAMDKDRLLQYFRQHYLSRQEVLFKLPLNVSIDTFWPELLNRRKAGATILPLSNASGMPYWYVLTDKMIAASERLCEEAMEQEDCFDPYRAPMTSAMTEEMFFTSFVEGAQIPLQEAMDFLQRGTEPENIQEQMIWNNRHAWSGMIGSLYRPLDEGFIKSAAQLDGTKARYSFAGKVTSLNNKNGLSCVVYYKLKTATAWTTAEQMAITSYTLSATNKLLSQTFDALYSYDLKVRLTDYFYYVEQAVSIGTKGVILDFMADGTGIGIGKVAETSGYIDCGWPLKLSTALAVAYGGTGATSAAGAIANLGGVKKTGDTMTGNLNISGYLYPSMLLLPTYNDTTNRTVFEGSYVGASSFAAWEDSTGNNRRMLEVRTKSYAASLDNAVMVRVCDNGTWGNYRVFHSGMPTGVPVANGGTGATTAANARSNLGTNNAGNITAGTLAMARLPFKVAYGSGSVSGSSALSINYSGAGFTSIPCVVVSYSTSSGNWSGDNGALKVHSKTTTGATIIVGGSFNTARNIDWIAIGV